jgi:hypothetical protein
VTDLALLHLDAMVAITMDERGLPKFAHIGSLRPVSEDGDPVELLIPTPPANLDFDFQLGFATSKTNSATRTRSMGCPPAKPKRFSRTTPALRFRP